MTEKNSNSAHEQRMKRLKSKVDAGIAKAKEFRGICILLTGNGKGKTTSAFGNLVRCLGHGMSAGATQFIKGQWQSGEVEFILKQCPNLPYYAMKTDFTWESQNFENDKLEAQKAWEFSKSMLQDPSLDMVVLDEITYMITYKYLDIEDILSTLAERPAHQTVILTGRSAHRQLVEFADTVSELQDTKHAFQQGIMAQKGIDW